MRETGFLLLMSAVVLCLITSCSKEKDNHQEKWMVDNVNALNAIKSNPAYKELASPGNEGHIYYKVLQAGEGNDTIRYTSSVKCYYKGWFAADYPLYNITKGDTFDKQLFDDGPPTAFIVSGVVSGWKTALQHMVKGDKWEVWIPYELGYGREGTTDSYTKKLIVPGYSTLVFELEIIEVKHINDSN